MILIFQVRFSKVLKGLWQVENTWFIIMIIMKFLCNSSTRLRHDYLEYNIKKYGACMGHMIGEVCKRMEDHVDMCSSQPNILSKEIIEVPQMAINNWFYILMLRIFHNNKNIIDINIIYLTISLIYNKKL